MSNTVAPNPEPVEAKEASLRSALAETTSKIECCVKQSPRTTMLVSIGAGVGLGVVLGAMIGGSRRSQSSSWLDRATADRIGERVAANLSHWLPDSISDRF